MTLMYIKHTHTHKTRNVALKTDVGKEEGNKRQLKIYFIVHDKVADYPLPITKFKWFD